MMRKRSLFGGFRSGYVRPDVFSVVNRAALHGRKRGFAGKWVLVACVALGILLLGAVVFMRQGNHPMDASAYVPVWNWNLVSKTVVIDAGHGGIDPGTIGVTGVEEKTVNLAVAIKVKEILQQSGVRVVMIREDDRDFGTSSGPSMNKSEDLAYRTKVVEEAGADIILSIHGNSFPDSRQQGAQVFYYKGSEEGQELAQSLQDRLNNVTKHPRIVRSDTFYMLRNTRGIALTVEIGFLSSPAEEKRLVDPEYQSRIALAIALGVANYLEK